MRIKTFIIRTKSYSLAGCEVRKFFTSDFVDGLITACYVVCNGEAVVVNANNQTRREIEAIINELKP